MFGGKKYIRPHGKSVNRDEERRPEFNLQLARQKEDVIEALSCHFKKEKERATKLEKRLSLFEEKLQLNSQQINQIEIIVSNKIEDLKNSFDDENNKIYNINSTFDKEIASRCTHLTHEFEKFQSKFITYQRLGNQKIRKKVSHYFGK